MTKTTKVISRLLEAVGKTVSGIGLDSNRLVIAFSDGSVLAFHSEGDCDDSCIEQEWQSIDLARMHWATAAEEAGLLTHEEWKQAYADHRGERAERLRSELEALENQ